MGNTIHVLIVDDHSIARAGLASILGAKKDIEVVGEASCGTTAISKALLVNPDVVIMDLMMPKMDGIETTVELSKHVPSARVLILTSFASSDKIKQALDAGACGAILKSASNKELVTAIKTVAAGEQFIADDIEQLLTSDPPLPKLSQRQSELLESISRGLTNQEAAKMIGISTNSVKRHLQILFTKLGAANRSEAASIAQRKHLLKP